MSHSRVFLSIAVSWSAICAWTRQLQLAWAYQLPEVGCKHFDYGLKPSYYKSDHIQCRSRTSPTAKYSSSTSHCVIVSDNKLTPTIELIPLLMSFLGSGTSERKLAALLRTILFTVLNLSASRLAL